ncbi:MAG: hypothetical protein ACKO81_12605 [Planctomycetota bacterium]
MLDWLRKKLLSDSTPPATRSGKRRTPATEGTEYQLLENRQLMATLLSSSAVSFQDVDGDRVTVNFSGRFLTASNVNSIFQFDTGSVDGSNAARQQLRSLNLGSVPGAARTSITTSVEPRGGLPSNVHIGQIMAEGIDLGDVTITGNLGRIRAGDSNARTQALGTLNVEILGGSGTLFGAANLQSETNGSTRALNVRSWMIDSNFRTERGGNIGSVSIGGTLIGSGTSNSGSIYSSGNIGNVTVAGSVLVDAGTNSGSIYAFGNIGAVTVGGAVSGGGGQDSGSIVANGNLTSITVGSNLSGGRGYHSGRIGSSFGTAGAISVRGTVWGGEGFESGQISVKTAGRGATIDIGGSVEGWSGSGSGSILVEEGSLSRLTIGGDLRGGGRSASGAILVKDVTTLTVNGSVVGGSIGASLEYSGHIRAGKVSNLTIGRDLIGGIAPGSETRMYCGSVIADNVSNFVVGGSLISGLGLSSRPDNQMFNGAIFSRNAIDNLTIRGDVRGNSTQDATIIARGQIRPRGSTDLAFGTINIAGNVDRAKIKAGSGWLGTANPDAQIGSVTVGGNWTASELGAGTYSRTGDRYSKLTIAGVPDSSRRLAKIGSIAIGGSVRGTSAAGDNFGFIAEEIGRVRVGGSDLALIAGPSNDNRLLDSVFGDTKLFEY